MTTFVELKNGMVLKHVHSNFYEATEAVRLEFVTIIKGQTIILKGLTSDLSTHRGGMHGASFNVTKVWNEGR